MKKTEMETAIKELRDRINEIADPEIEAQARLEKLGAAKAELDKVEKGVGEAYDDLGTATQQLFDAMTAPGNSREPPKPEEEKHDLDSMLASFIERHNLAKAKQ